MQHSQKRKVALGGASFLLICLMIIGGLYYWYTLSQFHLDTTKLAEHVTIAKRRVACDTLENCHLQLGDIFIRRDASVSGGTLRGPYFDHIAIYMGTGMIFEVRDDVRQNQDEVSIYPIKESSWANRQKDVIYILRPEYSYAQIVHLEQDLRSIAADPAYRSGLPFFRNKTFYGAELIYLELRSLGFVLDTMRSYLVTPDYFMTIFARLPGSNPE